MRGSHEAFWWSLFSAGGVIAALLIPVLIFVTGPSQAFGWQAFEDALAQAAMQDLLSNQLVKAVLFVGIALPLFHALHRIRHLIIDLHVPVHGTPLAVICYAAALTGTGFAAFLIWRI